MLEGSLSTSQLLDDYVNGRSDDPRELVVSSVWDNQEMFTFLEWLRAHIASVPAEQRVRVFGLDAYILIMEDTKAPGRAAEAVVAYLQQVDPDYQPPHLDTIRRVFAGSQSRPPSTSGGEGTSSTSARWTQRR